MTRDNTVPVTIELNRRKEWCRELDTEWNGWSYLVPNNTAWESSGTTMLKMWEVREDVFRGMLKDRLTRVGSLRMPRFPSFKVFVMVVLAPSKGFGVAELWYCIQPEGWKEKIVWDSQTFHTALDERYLKEQLRGGLTGGLIAYGTEIGRLMEERPIGDEDLMELSCCLGRDLLIGGSLKHLNSDALRVGSRWLDKLRGMRGRTAREVYDELTATTFTMGVRKGSLGHKYLWRTLSGLLLRITSLRED